MRDPRTVALCPLVVVTCSSLLSRSRDAQHCHHRHLRTWRSETEGHDGAARVEEPHIGGEGRRITRQCAGHKEVIEPKEQEHYMDVVVWSGVGEGEAGGVDAIC